jgi:hypothetical protein
MNLFSRHIISLQNLPNISTIVACHVEKLKGGFVVRVDNPISWCLTMLRITCWCQALK